MSRYALSRGGHELPIDSENFEVVIRWSDRVHRLTGETLWYASDAADAGVLVISEVLAYVSDSLPILLRLLGDSGFTRVRVDMADFRPKEQEEGEQEEPGFPIARKKIDPWACAVPEGEEPPSRRRFIAIELESPFGQEVLSLSSKHDCMQACVHVFSR